MAQKISDLIKKLEVMKDLHGDIVVLLSSDSEGNRFEKMAELSGLCFLDEEEEEVFEADWTADEAGMDDDEEWESFKLTATKVVIIYP